MDSHLKQLQKQVAKEEKQEDKLVKTALKDLSHAHQAQSKAQKVLGLFPYLHPMIDGLH
jgi:hypothetical protein